MAKAKPTKKKTGKSSKASRGKKKDDATFGLPSDEDLEKEAKALDKKKKDAEGKTKRAGVGKFSPAVPATCPVVLLA